MMEARGHEVALFAMAEERGAATPYDDYFVPQINFKNGRHRLLEGMRLAAHAVYSRGAFDFLAAYVIPEDVWYLIPAKKLAGRGYVTLCSNSGGANFEEYREAWHRLREAVGIEEETAVVQPEELAAEGEDAPMGPAVQRVQNAFDFVRRQLEKGGSALRIRFPALNAFCAIE